MPTDARALADEIEVVAGKFREARAYADRHDFELSTVCPTASDTKLILAGLAALRRDAGAEMRDDGRVHRLAYETLVRALLFIAERPNAEAARIRIDGSRAMRPYYEGYDTAAASRASCAKTYLGTASILAPLTGELGDRFRALPLQTEEHGGAS